MKTIYKNDMGEKLLMEILKDEIKFYYIHYDKLGNEKKTLTRTMSIDFLIGRI